jgi:hypothetical protein
LVVGKIQKASKLSVVEFKVDKLVFGVKDKRILWVVKLNQAQFLAQSQAIIKAGVDLTRLEEEDVKINGRRISLKLPPVQVINFSYPAEQFQEIKLLSSNAFSTRITLEDQEKFFRDAELDIRNSLEFMDIRRITEDKTRLMLEALLKSLGYTEIFISFREGDLIAKIQEDGIE